MKLFICKSCYDVVSLRVSSIRYCECKKSGGHYLDSLNAEYWGEAIPLGFSNSSLLNAIQNRPQNGKGRSFEAFVIPVYCSTYKKANDK